MICTFCGSETKEWIKVGNVYVIIHHFCAKQVEEEQTADKGRRATSRPK